MALYTETCTIVRTDAGLSESFEVKVGLHQGSVLSPLLFAAVMDVVFIILFLKISIAHMTQNILKYH